jgi:hypothetical protein
MVSDPEPESLPWDENLPAAKTREIYLAIQMMEEMRKNLAIHQKTRMKKTQEEGKMAMEITRVLALGESIFLISSFFKN